MNSSYDPQIESLLFENRERTKELACINQTVEILKSGQPVKAVLQQICRALPSGWQHSAQAAARIRYGSLEVASPGFAETEWRQAQYFQTIPGRQGSVEVFYLQEFQPDEEGPFLKEERVLIDNLTALISSHLINMEMEEMALRQSKDKSNNRATLPGTDGRQLLQRFLANQNTSINTLHDLMPFKVNEILMVATLYDTFSIENEGKFIEHIMGEHYQNNIFSMPRITGVTSVDEARQQLQSAYFDLVIIMGGSDREMPFTVSRLIREERPQLPVFLLTNHTGDLAFYKERIRTQPTIDKIFIWSGDTKVFYTMVKYLEDRVNVANDTQVGLIKVILLVEDSEIYYSKYLPLLYNCVQEQTRRLVEEVHADNLIKALRARLRPKVILVSCYEEAMDVIHRYSDNLMCLITDVEFPKDGALAPDAGFLLTRAVRGVIPDLPIVIQSAELGISHKAFEIKATFIGKNSDTLLQEIRSFINHQMGFGSFASRDGTGKNIMSVRSMQDFEKQMDTLSDDALVYHAKHHHFSLWLMARGEIKVAKMIYLIKVTDFDDLKAYRKYMKFVLNRYRSESNAGKVVDFDEQILGEEQYITGLGSGNLGGKGRGLVFANTLIYNLHFADVINNDRLTVCTPRTAIIGADEFSIFIERNNLQAVIQNTTDYGKLKQAFLQSELPYNLARRLKTYLKYIQKPIAVRSSSMYEDSSEQPFSGVFETYLVPNNAPDANLRFQQLTDAIRLVYASLYAPEAREYFRATHSLAAREKMAIVLQEVVGNRHGDYFYPDISGTAQSYNYYPVAYMEPGDGFAACAVGLGKYVVDGGKSFRFSPKYPALETLSPQDQYKNSQTKFLALDLGNCNPDLLQNGEMAAMAELDISVAEQHGTLRHCAAVYTSDDRIEPGLDHRGPRVVNFADILRYGYIPLAPMIETILDLVKEAMGMPVEIEFAVELGNDGGKPATFYLLQVKPIIDIQANFELDPDKLNPAHTMLFSSKTMGNGQIDHITDVVYVDIRTFDKTDTLAMVAEIERLNDIMVAEKREYILIGPGRWGSRDRFIGIPVTWPQISSAKVVVEVGLPGLPLDPSLGSHFFHNVISMHVGYFSIPDNSITDFIRWNMLETLTPVNQTKYLKHVRFDNPLSIQMDGKNRRAAIQIMQEL
jgi:CheY-like chemotaxis protein